MRCFHASFVLALALAAGGCSKGEPAPKLTYGEPVGIQMAASQGLPAYEIALAATEGSAMGPLIAPVSKLVHDALVACPAVVTRGTAGQGAEVAFTVGGGKTSGPPPPEGDDGCLLRALIDRDIVAAQTNVLVQLRFGGAPKGAATGAP